MDQNTQLDFATLALKGKRYQEAENIYMQLISTNNSSEAWLGVGLCKLYQLSEGKTIDEVIFCLDKAKAISPQLVNELDDQLMTHTIIVLQTYAKLVEEAAAKHAASKKAAQTGALIAGVSLIAGANSNRAFGTIASLAGTGAGVGVAVNSLSAMSDYKELVRIILSKCNEALVGVSQVVDKQRPEYVEFENSVKTILGIVKNNSIDAPKDNVQSDIGKLLSTKTPKAEQWKIAFKIMLLPYNLVAQGIKLLKKKTG